MAKYPLIMRNETFMALLQHGAMQQPPKTLGKLINEILDNFVEDVKSGGQRESKAVCACCGHKASLIVYGKGKQQVFLCDTHKTVARQIGSYKKLEEGG